MNVLIFLYCNVSFPYSQGFFVVFFCVFAFFLFLFLPVAMRTHEIGPKQMCKVGKFFLGMLTSRLFFLLFSYAQSCLQNLPYSIGVLNLFIQSKNVYVSTKHQTLF